MSNHIALFEPPLGRRAAIADFAGSEGREGADTASGGGRAKAAPTESQRVGMIAEVSRVVGMGLAVFPARGKKPASKGWQERSGRTTASFRGLLESTPWATGYLICTGVPIGVDGCLFVLDVDPRNGGVESLGRLLADAGLTGLPDTATTRSAGHPDGRHYFLRAGVPLVQGAVKNFPGLDVKGWGAYVIGPGSIHPETGLTYEWHRGPEAGIADAPPALLSVLERNGSAGRRRVDAGPSATPLAAIRDRSPATMEPRPQASAPTPTRGPSMRPDSAKQTEARLLPDGVRVGVPRLIARSMIANPRFAVESVGTRWERLVRDGVAHLVGLGYSDQVALETLAECYDHFHARGVLRTEREAHLAEVRASLRATRLNPNFRPSTSGRTAADHVEACRAIEIQSNVLDLLCGQPKASPKSPKKLNSNSGTFRSVGKVRDRIFLEALLAIALHQAGLGMLGRDQRLTLTYDMLRDVAEARHPEVRWGRKETTRSERPDNTELKRQKARWVDRPGRPAKRTSLLKELKVGSRRVGEARGEPSEFELTGLLDLLANARVSRDVHDPNGGVGVGTSASQSESRTP